MCSSGIDHSTNPKLVGLALAVLDQTRAEVLEVRTGGSKAPSDVIAEWAQRHGRVLLALDAPLGWPMALDLALAGHQAGRPLGADANSLFRRATDDFVAADIGKRSLDVGADRIARTAHSALELIADLSRVLESSVELAWAPDFNGGIAAIEVYPAATLKTYGLPSSKYKKTDQRDTRLSIVEGIEQRLALSCEREPLLDNADILDAVLCVLAAKDFLEGKCQLPQDINLAKKEGWIWLRSALPS